MHLSAIAKVDRALEADPVVAEALCTELCDAFLDQGGIQRIDLSRCGVRRQRLGHQVLMHDVGGDQPERAIDRRGIGNHQVLGAELLSEGRREHAASAAEGVQDEVARVESALHRDLAHEVGDLCTGDLVDANGRLFHRNAERIGDHFLETAPRSFQIKRQLTAQKMAGVHETQQQHHVGDGRLGPAESVTDRPGPRTGAARADGRNLGDGIDRDDRAAAGTDGDHLDLGRCVVEAIDHGFARVFELSVLDHADLEGRPAHVCGNDVAITHQITKELCADHACGWPAFDHADCTARRLGCGEQSAVPLHDHGGAGVALAGQQLLQRDEIVMHDPAGISVDDRRGGALVLANHRRDVRGFRDVHIRSDPFDEVGDVVLMLGVVDRPEEGNGNRIHLLLVQQIANGLFGGLLVQRDHDLASAVDPLRDTADALMTHQGRCPLGLDRMFDAFLGQARPSTIGAACHEHCVFEPFRRQQASPGAFSREHRVVGDGRSVNEEFGALQEFDQTEPHRSGRRFD
ncbi:hypothetical protein D3C86_1145620 [compost metagenome]